jgi:hypothetical protein
VISTITVKVPLNTKTSPRHYTFHLRTGRKGHRTHLKITVVEAALTAADIAAPSTPVITIEPSSPPQAAVGNTVSFVAAATNALSAQWQQSVDGGFTWTDVYASAVSADGVSRYFVVANATNNGSAYRAIFTNTVGSVTTAPALLTVLGIAPTGPESTSSNWSGYVTSDGIYTSVTASWKVPIAVCAVGVSTYSAQWVGIDGISTPDVEQDGTSIYCEDGTPQYFAWYEMYGDDAVNNGYQVPLSAPYTVSPGDVITATTTLVGSKWIFTIADSAGWTSTTPMSSPVPAPAQTSAEWIVEAPDICVSTCTNSSPLTNFGTVGFTGATASRGGVAAPISALQPTALAMTETANTSTIRATPSALDPTGEDFTDTFVSS